MLLLFIMCCKCMFVGNIWILVSPLECTVNLVWYFSCWIHIVVSCLLCIIMKKINKYKGGAKWWNREVVEFIFGFEERRLGSWQLYLNLGREHYTCAIMELYTYIFICIFTNACANLKHGLRQERPLLLLHLRFILLSIFKCW